jgi:type VI secretion system protein ImpH
MSERWLDELRREAPHLDFFELVRLLEHALAVEVGKVDRAASAERVSFSHVPELAFPSSDVAGLELDPQSARVRTTFLGLLGTASPLTPEWTEQVFYDDDEGALQAFYDVFHQRALVLLYAAWKVHSLEGGFDLRGDDPLSKRLRSLAGVDGWTDAEPQPLAPMVALGLADYHRGQPQTIDLPSAQGLLRRLYPAWNVRLSGNVDRFVEFTVPERTRLGVARSRLGEDLVYGDGCVEAEGLVRLFVGPVDGATCESLMPGGPDYERLERVTRQLFAASVEVELEVELVPREAPTCALGRAAGGRLGVDTRYTADVDAPVKIRAPLLPDASLARRTIL